RRPLAVVRTSSVSVPALFGFLRPRLLLPESALRELGPDQLGDVIRHELEHLRHHDVAWNWFLQALVCLHWMNPFVWIAATRLRTDRETVRDLGVLDREPARTGRDYGRTILRVVESSARFRARALLVGILEDRSDVMRRITMIARYDGNSRRGLLLGAILTCLLALVVTAAAAEPPDAEPQANPKTEAPAKKAPKPAPRPWVLVTGYQADGDLFKKESRLDHAMEVVTE
ncbi:MAG: M56 family metallopeptidase, partial [Phycisphaeraceae bacterium]|nr:M56 family metallopeptidase [Phycisphaeraceae bacterium]